MGIRTLSAIITIGGAVSSSLGLAFGQTERSLGRLGATISANAERQRELNREILNQQRASQNANRLSSAETRRLNGLIQQHRLINRVTGERVRTPTTRAGAMGTEISISCAPVGMNYAVSCENPPILKAVVSPVRNWMMCSVKRKV